MGRRGTEGLTLWHWSSTPRRLVKVVVARTDDGLVASVYGHGPAGYELLERRTDATSARFDNRRRTGKVEFADDTTWILERGGCGCGHPLKKFDPVRSTVK